MIVLLFWRAPCDVRERPFQGAPLFALLRPLYLLLSLGFKVELVVSQLELVWAMNVFWHSACRRSLSWPSSYLFLIKLLVEMMRFLEQKRLWEKETLVGEEVVMEIVGKYFQPELMLLW